MSNTRRTTKGTLTEILNEFKSVKHLEAKARAKQARGRVVEMTARTIDDSLTEEARSMFKTAAAYYEEEADLWNGIEDAYSEPANVGGGAQYDARL